MKKNKFNIKDFKLLPAKQKQAIYVLGGSVLAFVIVVIAASVLIFGTAKPSSTSSSSSSSSSGSTSLGGKVTGKDADYKVSDGLLDLDKLKGTVLEKASAAGDAYIKDTLFVGDSNMERLVNLNEIGLDNFAGKTGMGISTFSTEACVYFEGDNKAYTIAKAVAKMKPRRVIMTFGTNDAGGDTSPKAFVDTYKKAITSIQKVYPYCDIIINTIPPVAKKRTYNNISMQTIDAFNVALADLAKEMDLKLLNSNEILRGEDGFGKASYFAAEDGIHFTEQGAKAFMEYVGTHSHSGEDKRPDTKNIPKRRKAPAPVSSDTSSSSEVVKKYPTVSYRVKVEDGKPLGTLKGDGFSGESQRNISFTKDITSISVTAVPIEGYDFTKWSDGVETATRTDAKVTESFSVTANFAKKPDPVTIKLDKGDTSVVEGDAFNVTAIVGGKVEAKNVVWKVDGVHVKTGESYSATLAVGSYRVEASIEGAAAPVGITVTVTKKVLPATISISGAGETTVGKAVTFTATVANADVSAVIWTVGGAQVGTGATYTNPAAAAGTFTITATVGAASASATLNIKAAPVVVVPTVSISGLAETTVGAPVTFTATVTGAEVSAVVWTVGGAAVGTGATYTNPAAAEGTVTITATVGTVSSSVTLNIKAAPPPTNPDLPTP